MNISDRIQHLRKSKGISQEELADKIGISRQAVSKWESEQSNPDIDKIVLLSEYFEVTTDYILKGIEPKISEINRMSMVSKILYYVSTFFIIVGLIFSFANWNKNQNLSDMLYGMIIQSIGIIVYFIGKTISNEKPNFYIIYCNIIFMLFMPLSIISGFMSITIFKNGWISPYPIGIFHGFIFIALFLISCILIFNKLKKVKFNSKHFNKN